MKKLSIIFAFLFLTIAATAQHAYVAGTKKIIAQADIVLRHVTVISMKDSIPVANQLIAITNNHISYIGNDNDKKIKTKAKVVDATGKYIMPGLAEMHSHMDAPKNIKNFFTLNLLAGVTSIRSMRGQPEHLAYRDIEDYVVPNLYLSAPVVRREQTITPQVADSMVKAINKAKYDFIKVLSIKDSSSFDNLMIAAKKYGMKVCGHKPREVSLEQVLNSGFVSIAHLGGYMGPYFEGEQELDKALTLTKKNKIYQDITLDWYGVVYHQVPVSELLQRPGMEYIHDTVKQQWTEKRKARIAKVKDSAYNVFLKRSAEMATHRTAIIRAMKDKRVGLLIGSEGGGSDFMVAGYNMVEEMKAMKKAGLSNYELLKCATVNAAAMLHQEYKWGTIGVGMQANMILLPSNPLIDLDVLTHVEAVILHNKLHTKAELLKQLD